MKSEAENGNDYRLIFKKLQEDIKSIMYIESEKQKDNFSLKEIKRVKQINDEELNDTKVAIAVLNSNYNKHKEYTTQRLQEELTKTINRFFDNGYNLSLRPGVNRGRTTIDLIDVDNDGNSVGSLTMMLSGAEQQMGGFSTQKITLANLGGDFMILDEAFSSFGVVEMKKMSDILRCVDDVQLILIEHKDLGDLKVPTYWLDRPENGLFKSTKIVATSNLDMIDWNKEFESPDKRVEYYTE